MRSFADKALDVMRSRYPGFPEPDVKFDDALRKPWVKWLHPTTGIDLLSVGDEGAHWAWHYALLGCTEEPGIMPFSGESRPEPRVWVFRRVCEVILRGRGEAS